MTCDQFNKTFVPQFSLYRDKLACSTLANISNLVVPSAFPPEYMTTQNILNWIKLYVFVIVVRTSLFQSKKI